MVQKLKLISLSLILAWSSLQASHCRADEDRDLGTQLVFKEPLVLPRAGGSTKTITFPKNRYQVFCFLGCECPLAKLYAPRLSALAKKYESKNFDFIGVNSNQQDSIQDIADYRREFDLSFPLLKDYDNRLADLLTATRTPEIIIVSPEKRIVYRGRVDNQYSPGVTRAVATKQDLNLALDQIVKGLDVSPSQTAVEGCLIGRVRDVNTESKITFTRHVARVLDQHCIECHRADAIGPFSLTHFEDAKGWAEMMVEVVDNGRMPPWHASPNHRPLANARNMPERDKQILRDWLAAGAPFGAADQLPPSRVFTEGWKLPRKPDLIVNMSQRGYVVPAQGVIDYQYFVVDPGFTEDKWITAAEVKPGNPQVVHHSIVFIRPPDGVPSKGVGWLSAFVPGQTMSPIDDSLARHVPAGSKFVFQQHYTPNGQPQRDNTSVGMLFADPEKVTHENFTLMGVDQQFEIPPREANFSVSVKLPYLPKNATLLSVAPHMHYRGKSFEMTTVDQSGVAKTTLEVPQYDFNWQHSYLFESPIDLSELKEIRYLATFDNSANNPFNPNPNVSVTWGDQTFEEMAVAFFEVSQPRNTKVQKTTESTTETHPFKRHQNRAKQGQVVDNFFDRFDRNSDGRIIRSEVTKAMKHFGFQSYDLNGDDQITREELFKHLSSNR
ncbi:MAG: redoxin domain-containing protein [Mariniblastus sp.]|nr:redoxin domain-containing protein [Mariniblastus sp.]